MGISFCDHKARIPLWVKALSVLLTLSISLYGFEPGQVRIISVEKGLSQSTVYDVVQDKDGYLWVATGEGLNRFDGYQFKTYYKEIRKPGGLNENLIRGLLSDDNGGIWIGTDKAIYFKAKGSESFKQYKFHPRYDRLSYIPLLRKGQYLWGVIHSDAIFKLNISTLECKIYPYKGLNDSPVIPDQNGNFWFKDHDNVLTRFSASSPKPSFTKLLNGVLAIGKNKDHQLHIIRADGLFKLNTKHTGRLIQRLNIDIPDPENIRTLKFTSSALWISRSNGETSFFLFKLNKWQVFNLNELKSGETERYYQIFEDSDANIWLASNENGLIQIMPSRLNFAKIQTFKDNSRATDFIKCFEEDKEGRILVGTNKEGLLIFDPNLITYRRIRLRSDLPDDPLITQIYSKDKFNFLISTQIGLYTYNHETGIKVIEPDHFYPGFTEIGSKLFLRKNGWINEISFPEGETDTSWLFYPHNIRVSYKLDNQKFFAAHKLFGAAILQPGKQLKTLSLPQFDNIRIFSIGKLSSNHFYLTSDIGIIITDSLFNIISTRELPTDLPQRHIYGLIRDSNGDYWGGTNKGLLRICMQQKRSLLYTLDHGLQSMEFNSEAFFKDSKGRFYFGGINGFNFFHPDSLPRNKHSIPVYLSEIKINQEYYIRRSTDEIKLPGKNHDLQLTFSTPEYIDPEFTELWVKMSGIHNQWINLKNRRIFTQAGVPPGKYSIQAKTRNADGVESEVFTLMKIEIDLPFYRKPINVILMLLISLLIVSSTLRRRQQLKIAKLQSERELEMVRRNIYRDLHDELGAGLSRIKILTDLALLQDGKKGHGMFLQVRETAAEVTGKLREIVWAMNPRNENLNGVLMRLQASTEEMLKHLPLQYEFNLPKTIPDMLLQPGTIRNLLLVHKEIMNNIQKYSRAEKVIVDIKVSGKFLKIHIADNGIGFDPAIAVNTGNGLSIMKERVKESGGTINLQSQPGKGTQIDLVFILKPSPEITSPS